MRGERVMDDESGKEEPLDHCYHSVPRKKEFIFCCV